MYENLKGRDFLRTYFHDHGVTDEELQLMDFWDGYNNCQNVVPDCDGLSYAEERLQSILNYRNLTADEVNEVNAPWGWPTAMAFLKCYHKPPKTNKDVWCVMLCAYNGKGYYFGIGKEEVEITEDMRTNGKWFVYSFSD